MTKFIHTDEDLDTVIAALVKADPRFAPILAEAGRPPLRRREGGFPGLAAIVVSQQLSTASANAIWGRLAAAYHSSATSPATYAERLPIIRAAADDAGRPMPRLSARTRVELDAGAESFYTMHGSPAEVAGEIQAFAALGVDHIALAVPPRDAAGLRLTVERFVREVVPLV